jgi:predicted protein tyrosine phosphatase
MNSDNSISQITPTLYLSNCKSAGLLSELQQRNITRVISLGDSYEHTIYARHLTIEYLPIHIDDSMFAKIEQHFYECNQYITSAPGAVLVHCYAGVSRSATIVIAHLMMHHQMNYAAAYLHVKNQRATIHPNEGFLQQLVELQNFINKNV